MKILVVDDEQDIQVLFEQRFRKEIRDNRVQFVFAFSGEEALRVMSSMTQEAVLILSDINMPGMNGFELLEKINALGIGPAGLGGRITALAVSAEMMPCHIASLPVAVNIQCHVARHKEIIL